MKDFVTLAFGWNEALQQAGFAKSLRQGTCQLITCEGDRCGFVHWDVEPDLLWLRMLCIVPKMQSKSIGSQALAKVISLCSVLEKPLYLAESARPIAPRSVPWRLPRLHRRDAVQKRRTRGLRARADLFCKPNTCISAAGKRSSATPEHVQRALRLRAPIAMRGNIHGSERVGFSSHIHGGRFEVKCKLAEIIGVQRTTPHSKAESSRIELIPAASAMRLCCVPDKLQLSRRGRMRIRLAEVFRRKIAVRGALIRLSDIRITLGIEMTPGDFGVELT